MFRNTGANAFAKNQTRLAYEDKRDLYCTRSATAPTVLPIAGGLPDAACSTLPCAAKSLDVACASPRPSRRRRPVRVMDSPVLTVQLGVVPLVDPGTDLEDELPMPAASPVTVDHGAAPRPTQVDVDVDLDRVFQGVATLPELVTPLCDPEGGGLVVTAAGYPVPAIPSASVVMTRPLVVPSPAGLADMDHVTPRSSKGSVDCSSALPVVSTPEGGQSSRAAPVDHCHHSSSSSFGGEPAGRLRFP